MKSQDTYIHPKIPFLTWNFVSASFPSLTSCKAARLTYRPTVGGSHFFSSVTSQKRVTLSSPFLCFSSFPCRFISVVNFPTPVSPTLHSRASTSIPQQLPQKHSGSTTTHSSISPVLRDAGSSCLPSPINYPHQQTQCHTIKRKHSQLASPLSFNSEADPPHKTEAALCHGGSRLQQWHNRPTGQVLQQALRTQSISGLEWSFNN